MSRSTASSLFLLASLVQFAPGATAGSLAHSDDTKIASRQSELKSYPCQRCHEGSKKPTPPGHELGELKHMNDVKNCSLCHKASRMNELVMLDGTQISFDQSSKLCGQCHGIKLREWSTGMHGKQSGHWNGEKNRVACTACHNPHNPKFKPMTAQKAPHFPKRGVVKEEGPSNE